MDFVYLRDGRRIDIDEGTTFVHRGEVLACLDADGNEAKRFDSREVTAYGHVQYPYDPELVSRPLSAEEMQAGPHRRHRRRLPEHAPRRRGR